MTIRTTVHLLAGLAVLTVSLPARAAPAEDPKRYLGTAKWYLDSTVHVHGTGQWVSVQWGQTTAWRINRTYNARSILDKAVPGMWAHATPESERPVPKGRFMMWKADRDKLPRPYILTGAVTVDDETEDRTNDATGTYVARTTWRGSAIARMNNTMEVYVDTVKKVYCVRVPYASNSYIDTQTPFVRREYSRDSFFITGQRQGQPFNQQSLLPPTDLEKVVPDPNTLLTMATGANAAGDWWTLQTPDMPLPSGGSALTGALSLAGRCRAPSDTGAKDVSVNIDVTWTCSPTPGPELELVVSLKGDGGETYENWVPLGGAAKAGGMFSETTPGNDIVATAELRSIETGKPIAKIDQIRFVLTGVSREPGVCMNAPWEPQAVPEPDLRFLKERNPGRVQLHGADGQRADEDAGVKLISGSTATITSFDYGGWGDLKVTAYLKDGRIVVGHLEGFPETKVIPLPKREVGSLIANRWLRDHGVVGKADKADDEGEPVGDQSKGDGLTLYEEYRGFADGGVWTSANPTRKDFFIRDLIGGRSKDGIDLFEGITQLNVHHQLYAWEIKDRVINFNHGAGPHAVDQHGVVLVRDFFRSGGMAYSSHPSRPDQSEQRPGTPEDILLVLIGTGYSPTTPMQEFTRSGRVVQRDRWGQLIAHELCHCCNVWHHGEKDERVSWITVVNPEGGNVQLFEYSSAGSELKQIVRLLEDGTLVPNRVVDEPLEVLIGVPQGPHSGNEDCVMRYHNAVCYRSRKPNHDQVRYMVLGREVVGNGLCEAAAGTGCNDPLHKPHSRYGDAHAGRGACRYQICVNDAVEPPNRNY